MFLKYPLFLHFFVAMGFEFAPAGGSPANISNQVITSEDYTEVEHGKAWRLSSSLAKILTVFVQ